MRRLALQGQHRRDMSEITTARQFWIRAPGHGEIVRAPLAPRQADEVLIRTRYSAISRGTESLVFRGEVPPSQHEAMRAPFQEGEFPGPVKYGYVSVGEVVDGPARGSSDLIGRLVFCLFPHQDLYLRARGSSYPHSRRRASWPRRARGQHGNRGERAVGRPTGDRRSHRRHRRGCGWTAGRLAVPEDARRFGDGGRHQSCARRDCPGAWPVDSDRGASGRQCRSRHPRQRSARGVGKRAGHRRHRGNHRRGKLVRQSTGRRFPSANTSTRAA